MKTNILVGIAGVLLALSTWAAGPKAPAKAPPQPTELTGVVARVIDGDTLWLKSEGQSEPAVIRLEGIDAPESCQPWGGEAKQALTELALNRSVTVKIVARDDHGRVVGKVYDGTKDLGDRLVRDGHAWSSRYKYDRGPYMAEERMAQALKRGLHGAGTPEMPRVFRQRHGPCAGDTAAPKPSAAADATPAVTLAAAAAPRCDGRQYCRQMTSCAEATWFLKNCPDMKMDGNRDGVPCEQQWCGTAR
jgi:endonuclease YncB( thermonuclease family)